MFDQNSAFFAPIERMNAAVILAGYEPLPLTNIENYNQQFFAFQSVIFVPLKEPDKTSIHDRSEVRDVCSH
jgi:hypothetical protein